MILSHLTEVQPLDTGPQVLICLLGGFELTYKTQVLQIAAGGKIEQLIVLLAEHRRTGLSRERIIDNIWPERSPVLAAQSLNALIYQVGKLSKRELGCVQLIGRDKGGYTLNPSPLVGVDVDQFDRFQERGRRLLAEGQDSAGVFALEQAIEIYRGDLKQSGDLDSLLERERLRGAYAQTMGIIIDHYFSRNKMDRALKFAQLLIRHDPCREDVHRLAMRCYVRLGLRALAFRQYQLCCQILLDKLDCSPESATVTLYDAIRLDPTRI